MVTTPSLSTWFKDTFAGFFLITMLYGLSLAGPVYQTRVRVVSADNGPTRTDPGIQDIINNQRDWPCFQVYSFQTAQ